MTTATPVAIDLSGRAKLRLTGSDRVRFLNGQVSQDVRLATEIASIYTCVMTIKGRMCADAFIHADGDALLLDAEPEVRETLAARLEKYIIADDVTLADVSDELGLLHWFPVVDSVAPEPVPGVRFVRSWRYGCPGLDVFGPADALRTWRVQPSAEIPFLDAEALETRRVLAGIPKWGAELDESTMPAETGLEERAVSYTKGCYIGQEVVSRVKSVGHVNRHLRGLRLRGPGELVAGMGLFPVEDAAGGREAGQVTSVAPDPADAFGSIALAFVRRGWESAGTVLAARQSLPAETAGGPVEVLVCELPFT